MTWPEWVRVYVTRYGFHTDRDVEMVTDWSRLLAADGYTPDEAAAAADWVATRDTPKYRNEHLAALVERLKTARASARQARVPQPSHDCPDCGGTGRAGGLPNFEAIERTDRWYTCCVFCSCPQGAWLKSQDKLGLMTLGQYEAAWPRWREELAKRKESDRRYQSAQATASSLDRTLGALLELAKAGRPAPPGPRGESRLESDNADR